MFLLQGLVVEVSKIYVGAQHKTKLCCVQGVSGYKNTTEYKTELFFFFGIDCKTGWSKQKKRKKNLLTFSHGQFLGSVCLQVIISLNRITTKHFLESRGECGRLFSSTLPRQALHEAAGYRRNDDDPNKQGGWDSDHQRDEEEVSSWKKRWKKRTMPWYKLTFGLYHFTWF